MDVIVHQYEGMDSNAMGRTNFTQQATEVMAIFVIEEDGGTVDATLSNMEGNAGEYESGATWHAETASDGVVRACPWS
jgi:hypothetical protein